MIKAQSFLALSLSFHKLAFLIILIKSSEENRIDFAIAFENHLRGLRHFQNSQVILIMIANHSDGGKG